MSKATISTVEAGEANVTVDLAGRLLSTLGVAIDLRFRPPFAELPQRDAGHARCVAYVQRRLQAAGWQVRREVEIVDRGFRGWIDVLAWDPAARHLAVFEVKTEIRDVGQIERTLALYRRGASRAAAAFGWPATTTGAWLLVLATELNEQRLRENASALAQSFPSRPGTLAAATTTTNALALIDPARRKRDWLLRSRVDGRRSAAPYRDYADFVSASGVGRSRRANGCRTNTRG